MTVEHIVYVGTYTEKLPHVAGKAEGIYTYRLEPASGELHYIATTTGVENPSFLTVAPSGKTLYAVEEIAGSTAQPGGVVRSFALDPVTHEPTVINGQPTGGAFPCYVTVDRDERWVLVANHGGGSISVFPIGDGGALGSATCVVEHPTVDGAAPHPHAIRVDPSNRWVLVPDAGLDRVYVYHLNDDGVLTPNDPPFATVPTKTGPRHIDFSPDGSFVYAIGEGASTMTVLRWDAATGTLEPIQAISTLPPGFDARSACADVHVHPSGWYVYGSNRGDDSIVTFQVEAQTGHLAPAGHVATGGTIPRGFTLAVDGTIALVANQNSDTVVAFTTDPENGTLIPTDLMASIPTPVCLCVVEYPAS